MGKQKLISIQSRCFVWFRWGTMVSRIKLKYFDEFFTGIRFFFMCLQATLVTSFFGWEFIKWLLSDFYCQNSQPCSFLWDSWAAVNTSETSTLNSDTRWYFVVNGDEKSKLFIKYISCRNNVSNKQPLSPIIHFSNLLRYFLIFTTSHLYHLKLIEFN